MDRRPPAVATLAWVPLGGRWDGPAASTFPLAAATSALQVAGHAGAGDGYTWLGGVTLAGVSVLVTELAARTALAVGRGEICRPDQP